MARRSERDLTLGDAERASEGLSIGVRLRIAVELFRSIASTATAPSMPRSVTSRMQFDRVAMPPSGAPYLMGSGDASGTALLLWEVLAGRALGSESPGRLHDSVDDLPADVDDLLERLFDASDADHGDAPPTAQLFDELRAAGEPYAVDTVTLFKTLPWSTPSTAPVLVRTRSGTAPATVPGVTAPPATPSGTQLAAPVAGPSAPTGGVNGASVVRPRVTAEAPTEAPAPVTLPMPAALVMPAAPVVPHAPPPPSAPASPPALAKARRSSSKPPRAAKTVPPVAPAPPLPVKVAAPPAPPVTVPKPTPYVPAPSPHFEQDAVAKTPPRGTPIAMMPAAARASVLAPIPAPSPPSAPPHEASRAEPNVLLIHSGDPAALLADALRGVGYEVVVKRDAASGFAHAVAHNPMCILCDSDLPDADGEAVVRKLRALKTVVAHTPFMLLASRADTRKRVARFGAGADVCLMKPIRPSVMIKQVDALVDMASRLRAAHRAVSVMPQMSSSAACSGDIKQVGIGVMLTIFEMERRTGVFAASGLSGREPPVSSRVTISELDRDGRLELDLASGCVAGASSAGVTAPPLDVVRAMLRLTDGRFVFKPLKPRYVDAPRLSEILAEAARLEDEAVAARS